MADARGEASRDTAGSTSTRPARLRVIRPDVQEVLKSPRRSRPKKQQAPPPPPSPSPPPPPPPPPPPRKVKEKEEEEEFERARYGFAFQDEAYRDFAPPDLVWGKVRSHPWWPGQVFDAADASEVALQHRRAGAPLVAYFWDRTFAWTDASALLPFRANFARLSAQSTMSGFVSAVDAALQEVGRRVEAGLSCGCFGSSIATKQEVENSGVRQGAYGAAVDSAYMRDAFRGEAFLDYILALGKKPLPGADLLDIATAKAQLRAFNQSRGPRDLPEFVTFEGIEDVVEAIPYAKRKRMYKSFEDDVPSKKKQSRRARRKEALPEAANEEAMDKDSGVPSRGATDDRMSRGKKSKHTESLSKKVIDSSKYSDGLEIAAVGDSQTPANKTADDVLSESKSGRTLRSMRKKEDALEGLKRLGEDDSGETLTGKNKDVTLLKENKLRCRASFAHKKEKIMEDGDGLGDGNANGCTSPGKRRSGHAENSISKRVHISEHGRKKKKLSELMAETGRPNSARGGKSKTRGKQPLHEPTEKPEDPDCDSEDTVKTRKRKKLNTLGDLSSQSQPLSRKKSTKVGEMMSKAAGCLSQTPPVVKANGAASQTKSRRAKNRQVNAADKSSCSVKVNRGKKDAFAEESLSCGEMLWQLSVAACDLQHRAKIAPTSVNFLTDFRNNSYVSTSDVDEIPEKAANTELIPERATNTELTPEKAAVPEKVANSEYAPSEQPIADHMQDDYWADILINVEEPLSSLKKKKDGSKKRTGKKAHRVKKLPNSSSMTLGSADEPRSESKQDAENGEQLKAESKPTVANGSELNAGTKSSEEMENSLLAGLVLHFNRPSAVPSRSDLIKIFSQYGPVNEAKSEIANNAYSAQVIFKRRMDAEAAFAGAGKISALGPALVSFRLSDFPAAAAASGNEPLHGASKSE